MRENRQVTKQDTRGFFSDCCFLEIPEKSIRAIWEVTHYCPFNCTYCFTSSGPNIPLQDNYFQKNYGKIIGRLHDLGVKDVLVTGGEPLALGKNIVSAMVRMKSAGMTFSISTTGYDLERFQAVLEAGPQKVNLSFDPGLLGARMKSSIEEVKKRIALCRDANIPVKLSGVIMPDEMTKVEEYLNALPGLLKEFPNIRTIADKERYHFGAYEKDPHFTSEEYEAYGKLFRSMRIPSGIQKFAWVNWPQLHAPLDQCFAGKSIMAVLPDGGYAACSLLFYLSESFRLGNLLNDPIPLIQKKLADYVEHRKRQSARLKDTDELCSSCKVRAECGTGCPAMLLVANKRGAGPLCRFHALSLRDKKG